MLFGRRQVAEAGCWGRRRPRRHSEGGETPSVIGTIHEGAAAALRLSTTRRVLGLWHIERCAR